MMIKVANEFLDFNDLIEVEKQIKLFEEIATTDGDFSYAFELAKTINNTRILQNPLPDNISKPVYQKIPAKLLGDSGAETYDGYLRIERITDVYQCSFFAGNNNWFGLLSGSLQQLDWSQYDLDQTESNIAAAIFNTDGIVFPFIDNGLLNKRAYSLLKVEDFVAGIYVKTVFNKVFSSHGIKIQGEFLNDVNYLSAITLSNNKSEEQILSRSCFVLTTNSPNPSDDTYHKMQWTDETNDPYFDGGTNNFDLALGRYVADVKMLITAELIITQTIVPVLPFDYAVAFYLNGVLHERKLYRSGPVDSQDLSIKLKLEAGDYIEAYTKNNALGVFDDPITHATLKITPLYIYKVFGNDILPAWTQQQYVSNVFRMFNVLASYKEATQTLTLNLFQKIKDKTPIDLSENISETEVDYSEFISDYGKSNLLSFKELVDDTIKVNYFKYDQGVVPVDNDFLPDSDDLVDSEFTQPIGYINNVFDSHVERTNIIEVEEEITVDITGVSEVVSDARFAVSEDEFEISDLIRITDSTNPNYNGDWNVKSVGAGWVELTGVSFDTDARARITKLNFLYSDSDDVFIFHNVPLYTINKFSGLISFTLENTDYETFAYAFFNILNTGRQVNRDFINSMSFSGEDNPLHYQQTLINQYFRLFSQVLNDPVKLISVAHLPYSVYHQIDFLSPIMIRTIESTNMYYLNRISGYKESYLPCSLELIKL
jgi:hypothetical protein